MTSMIAWTTISRPRFSIASAKAKKGFSPAPESELTLVWAILMNKKSV
jgi:hypothetical protein